MARKKEYIEEEVIEKAMQVFWLHGYGATSVRMLEKGMGINQFSMYAAFKNKKGVFIECLRHYKRKLRKTALQNFIDAENTTTAIRTYLYDFLNFSKTEETYKGCLLTNTVNELHTEIDDDIASEIEEFTSLIQEQLILKLGGTLPHPSDAIKKQANYLFVTLQGLSGASKMVQPQQLDDYIDLIFKNIS